MSSARRFSTPRPEGLAVPQPADRVGGFRWEKVDPDLMRALLLKAAGPRQLVLRARFKQLEREVRRRPVKEREEYERETLADVATRRFRQGGVERLRPVAIVLRDKWIPQARAESIESLATMVEAKDRTGQHRSLSDERRHLMCHDMTHSFETNLIKEFQRAHWDTKRRRRSRKPADLISRIRLEGEGIPARKPHEYVVEAWDNLDNLRGAARNTPVRAVVELPTGAGKTDLAAGWCLRRLVEEADLRVLWLSHRVALV